MGRSTPHLPILVAAAHPFREQAGGQPSFPPEVQGLSSVDSSKSSEESPLKSLEEQFSSSVEDSPRKAEPPTPLKADVFTHDRSVNVSMGSGGIQVKADYSKPAPSPLTTPSTCTIAEGAAQRPGSNYRGLGSGRNL